MTRPDEPTQARVLRDRAARVPWREAFREGIRDLRRNGRAALPERLEGAVYGQLVGQLRGSAEARTAAVAVALDADGARMLDLLDSLLRPEDDAGGETAARIEGMASGSPAAILPVPLVMRAREPGEIVDLATRASGVTRASGEARVACALYALVIRRFVVGDRGRDRVLRRAIGELQATLARRRLPGSPGLPEPAAALAAVDALVGRSGRPGDSPDAEWFWSGWRAFAGSTGYADALARAHAGRSDTRLPAAVAGGLAGAYWGDQAIPSAWRRGLPEASRVRSLVDGLVETDAPGWDGETWRTSTSSPLVVDRLDATGLDVTEHGAAGPGPYQAGSVGITSLPGRRYVGYHTGAHWRDLDTDAARLRELGVDVVLLLVEDHELVRCRVVEIAGALPAHGVDLVRFPIRDPLLPRNGVAFRETIAALLERVRGGESVAIACRGGLDRAGMAGACLLREAGLRADEAIDRVQRARRGALTLPDQQAYVRGWPPRR